MLNRNWKRTSVGRTADATMMVEVTKQSPADVLGLTFESASSGRVYVSEIFPGLVSQSHALLLGDVVLAVNGVRIKSPEQCGQLLRRAGGCISFEVLRFSEARLRASVTNKSHEQAELRARPCWDTVRKSVSVRRTSSVQWDLLYQAGRPVLPFV